jgi:hypothetical protein
MEGSTSGMFRTEVNYRKRGIDLHTYGNVSDTDDDKGLKATMANVVSMASNSVTSRICREGERYGDKDKDK